MKLLRVWLPLCMAALLLSAFTATYRLTVTPPTTQTPTLSINGSTAPNQTLTGSTMTVKATGGPGQARDFLMICLTGGACDGGTYDSAYLNCTPHQPAAPYPTATPSGGCTFNVPSTVSSAYYLAWQNLDTGFMIASLPFGVSSGPPSITISAVSVSPNSITPPATFSGTLSATCSTACPGTANFALSTACTSTDNSLFNPISGTTLTSNGQLTQAKTYNVGVAVTMTGAANTGACFTVAISGGVPAIVNVSVNPNTFSVPQGGTASFSGTLAAVCLPSPCPNSGTFSLLGGGGTPTITVNGASSGASVSAGASMTVAVSNGPGHVNDYMGIFSSLTPSAGTLLSWDYLNCTATQPGTGLTSASCAMTAPASAGNYYAMFQAGGGTGTFTTTYASASFTVTGGGGGGGPVQPFGNIPCPRGCTWTNQFNADFTTMSPSFPFYDSSPNVTNAMYYAPPDGSPTDAPAGVTTACYTAGMIDTSTMPGYLSLHPIGTLAWEVPGAVSCSLVAKVSNTQTPPGCNINNIAGYGGWYTPTCVPITKPTLWEYKSQGGVNLLNQYTIAGYLNSPVGNEPTNCQDLKYLSEARGNGFHVYSGFTNWSSGCVGVGNFGFQQRDFTPQVFDDSPHVLTLVFDPQSGWTSYWDGVLQTSPTYPNGVVNIHGCAPGVQCMDQWISTWDTEVAISNYCGGGACAPTGTWAIYWERAYTGQ